MIFSKSVEEHAKHVETVLSLLRQHKYKVSLDKCEFGRTKILYLGHEVSAEGIRPEDAKVASFRDWPRPQTVTEVRSFLGMCGYYRNFVKNYSTVVSPLTHLTRLDTPWDWNDECKGAFKRLKHALMNHEVLMVPDPHKPFIVTTNANQYGIGAMLGQQDGKTLRPIEYMSKKIPSKKLAKSTYERELYALYKALVHWRHFLLGRFFYLRTDHQTLKWIKTQPALSDALKRWIEVIDQYDFKLEYLKGEYNKAVDALSRRVDYLGALVSDFGVSDEVTQSLVGAYQEVPVTMDIIRKLQAKDKAAEIYLDGMEGVSPDKFYIIGTRIVKTILNDEIVLQGVIGNGSEVVIINEKITVRLGLNLDTSYLFEIETADGGKQKISGVCHKAAIEVEGLRVLMPVFAVRDCSSELLLGRTWLSHVHAVTLERLDGSQMLFIKHPDGGRIVIETVEPRDPRNRAALATAGSRKPATLATRSPRFREKKYGALLTEEEWRIVEVEDLGNRVLVGENSYPKAEDEEFGGMISVSFLRA
ncbi:hypothetical protein CBR_g2755 [Chara braunii]|uniref:Reverse transcriptase/retrotransposon-derived protein RNase H-like domain-containing protein n=1 Tax=Chara braunii TaxID=69332 RepID=A0A388KE33_CHABU|nr:hypothetical protein CBR_g2755 [Chara braunii]|eukprot:GBG68203.1 hypothetical protein CBR_g2755 [Chara braunii]